MGDMLQTPSVACPLPAATTVVGDCILLRYTATGGKGVKISVPDR